MGNALCSYLKGGQSGSNWSWSRCLVGQLKGFIGSTALVYISCCFIPIFGGGIQGASKGHRGDGVLDLWVKSLSELDYGSIGICIPCFCYQLYKFIQVVIYRPGLLLVTGRLQFVNCHNIKVGQAEIFLEFLPVEELRVSSMFFFPLEDSLGPLSCSPGLHV